MSHHLRLFATVVVGGFMSWGQSGAFRCALAERLLSTRKRQLAATKTGTGLPGCFGRVRTRTHSRFGDRGPRCRLPRARDADNISESPPQCRGHVIVAPTASGFHDSAAHAASHCRSRAEFTSGPRASVLNDVLAVKARIVGKEASLHGERIWSAHRNLVEQIENYGASRLACPSCNLGCH